MYIRRLCPARYCFSIIHCKITPPSHFNKPKCLIYDLLNCLVWSGNFYPKITKLCDFNYRIWHFVPLRYCWRSINITMIGKLMKSRSGFGILRIIRTQLHQYLAWSLLFLVKVLVLQMQSTYVAMYI